MWSFCLATWWGPNSSIIYGSYLLFLALSQKLARHESVWLLFLIFKRTAAAAWRTLHHLSIYHYSITVFYFKKISANWNLKSIFFLFFTIAFPAYCLCVKSLHCQHTGHWRHHGSCVHKTCFPMYFVYFWLLWHELCCALVPTSRRHALGFYLQIGPLFFNFRNTSLHYSHWIN